MENPIHHFWKIKKVLDIHDKSLSDSEKMQLRREALLTDLFITGTNAVTEDGCLVNLDMVGNRVGALTFGLLNELVLTGRNKIVPDIQSAMDRIKNYTAPANVMRLDMKTPCIKTGFCSDCKSSQRICNTWTITEKSFPKKRVKIVLINEDLDYKNGKAPETIPALKSRLKTSDSMAVSASRRFRSGPWV